MNFDKISVQIDGTAVSHEQLMELEIQRSRENLRLIREKLGFDGMCNLFEKEILEEAQRFKELAASFDGTYRPAIVEMEVEGVTAEEYLEWFFKHASEQDGMYLLHNSPDHLSTKCENGGASQTALESMFCFTKPMLGQLRIPDPQGMVQEKEYDIVSFGGIYNPLDDTPLHMRTFHQFQNTDTGVKVKLCIHMPASASDEIVRGQQLHLALEWQNWFEMLISERDAARQE